MSRWREGHWDEDKQIGPTGSLLALVLTVATRSLCDVNIHHTAQKANSIAQRTDLASGLFIQA